MVLVLALAQQSEHFRLPLRPVRSREVNTPRQRSGSWEPCVRCRACYPAGEMFLASMLIPGRKRGLVCPGCEPVLKALYAKGVRVGEADSAEQRKQ